MQALENKVPPPIVAVICAAAMWGLSFIGSAIEINVVVRVVVIILLLASGVFFGVSSTRTFNKAATTINPSKPETASSLVSSGIYQISRNPMYVGLALYLAAWAVYLSSVWPFIGVVGFILYTNRFQIVPEERALLGIFGSEFESYKSKVRRWL